MSDIEIKDVSIWTDWNTGWLMKDPELAEPLYEAAMEIADQANMLAMMDLKHQNDKNQERYDKEKGKAENSYLKKEAALLDKLSTAKTEKKVDYYNEKIRNLRKQQRQMTYVYKPHDHDLNWLSDANINLFYPTVDIKRLPGHREVTVAHVWSHYMIQDFFETNPEPILKKAVTAIRRRFRTS